MTRSLEQGKEPKSEREGAVGLCGGRHCEWVGTAHASPRARPWPGGLHSQHCLRRLGQGSQARLNWGPGQTALPFPSPFGRTGCVGRMKLPEPLACQPPAHTGCLQRSSDMGDSPESPYGPTNPHSSQSTLPTCHPDHDTHFHPHPWGPVCE